MKKILVAVSALVLGTTAMAQTDQGTWLVGGASNLGYSSSKVEDADGSTSNISLDLKAGYFLIDRLAAGLGVGFGSESYDGDNISSEMSIGPWVRYYLPMNIYGELGFGFTSLSAGGEKVGSGTELGIGAGYAIFVNDHVAIEPSLNYTMGSFKPDGADESTSVTGFGLNVGITLFLGN